MGLDLQEVAYGGPTFETIKLLWRNGERNLSYE